MSTTAAPTVTTNPALDTCPTCHTHATVICPCPVGERQCAGGHIWHGCQQCRGPALGPVDGSVGMTNEKNWCEACRDKTQEIVTKATGAPGST